MLSTFAHLMVVASLALGSHGVPVEGDGVCVRIADILCVRDVLGHIASQTKNINRTLTELERSILERAGAGGTTNYYIDSEMEFVHKQLPKPQYHTQFNQKNNINQNDLTQLFLEAHYAMSFYHNTINSIVKAESYLASSSDSWLNQIKLNLRTDIICRYRSILNVYSYDWPSIYEVGRIEFSQGRYRDAPSQEHETRAAVIARLLREWMRRIQLVIANLESKLV